MKSRCIIKRLLKLSFLLATSFWCKYWVFNYNFKTLMVFYTHFQIILLVKKIIFDTENFLSYGLLQCKQQLHQMLLYMHQMFVVVVSLPEVYLQTSFM
jgi:hypothetical protein